MKGWIELSRDRSRREGLVDALCFLLELRDPLKWLEMDCQRFTRKLVASYLSSDAYRLLVYQHDRAELEEWATTQDGYLDGRDVEWLARGR